HDFILSSTCLPRPPPPTLLPYTTLFRSRIPTPDPPCASRSPTHRPPTETTRRYPPPLRASPRASARNSRSVSGAPAGECTPRRSQVSRDRGPQRRSAASSARLAATRRERLLIAIDDVARIRAVVLGDAVQGVRHPGVIGGCARLRWRWGREPQRLTALGVDHAGQASRQARLTQFLQLRRSRSGVGIALVVGVPRVSPRVDPCTGHEADRTADEP